MKQRLLRYWDHAFSNGRVFLKPSSLFAILDWPIMVFEYLYGKYAIRRVWREFEENAIVSQGVRLGCNARIVNVSKKESVYIGNQSVVRGILKIEKGGFLSIGDNCYIGDGVIISVYNSISIGDGTLIAHGVQIFDNITHPLLSADREKHFKMILNNQCDCDLSIPNAAIKIGKKCWIGMNSIILKGVKIGDSAIIGAGIIVTKDCRECTIVVNDNTHKVLSGEIDNV